MVDVPEAGAGPRRSVTACRDRDYPAGGDLVPASALERDREQWPASLDERRPAPPREREGTDECFEVRHSGRQGRGRRTENGWPATRRAGPAFERRRAGGPREGRSV